MSKLSYRVSFVLLTAAFVAVSGFFVADSALALGKDGINLGQFLTKTTPYSIGADLNKINSSSEEIKILSPDSLITKTGEASLKKSQYIEGTGKNYVEGEILIKYKNTKINLNTSSGRVAALNFISSKSLENKENIIKANISVLKIKDSKTVEQKIAELKNDPNIEYAEPNYKRYPAVINTTDTNRGLLWGLDNIGQSVNGVFGTNNADINAPEAWSINEGTNSSIIVAVIDSGVAYNHPDLLANMWDGSNCKNDNGVTIVGGCNHGYDYEDGDNTPLPTTSFHGTHIAGTIAAAINNDKGIIGVAPKAKIMAIKYGNDIASEIKAIDFAIQNGAKVINASFAGVDFSRLEYDAINRFKTAGGIFVAAAGNESVNNESIHSYPSDCNLDNIISVAATDQNDALASFSNYGATSVDVGAPGVNIYSAVPQLISSNVLYETFEGITPPNIPNSWVIDGGGTWGVLDMSSAWPSWGKVLFSDIHTPYANNANTTITSPSYNLGNTASAQFDFWTACDTEYYSTLYDYMVLEISSDGVIFTPWKIWDEYQIDSDSSSSGYAAYHVQNIEIPSDYLTSNFKFRFRWVTDSSGNNYGGCAVDDVKITKNNYDDGSSEKYEFYQGTSMAAPHVAGLAALIEGYNPNLTTSQVKNIILTSGDDISALDGKTSAGTRINAQKALQAANPTKAITAFNFTTPATTGVINESAHTIAVTVPSGTNVTALVPTITIAGAFVSPLSGVAQDFTNPVTYTVIAADSSTQDYVVTVTVATPSNIATVTSAIYTVGADTITNVPFRTSKTAFLTAITKGESNQTWNDAGITDPVVSTNTLVVTAQDGITIVAYTVTVLPATTTINWSNPADIVYGTVLSSAQLNATASVGDITVDGTFTYTPDSGTVLNVGASQTLSVTFTPTNIADYTTATKTVSINVTPATLTISGVTANDKTYNGTTSATIEPVGELEHLSGVISPDSVSIDSSSATGTFDNKNVGNGKIVTVSGLVLTGIDAGNYTLTQPTTTANITTKVLTVSATADNKTYDGTIVAIVHLTTDAIEGDTVTPSNTSASFSDKSVGTGKTVSILDISISGTDAGNYNLTNTTAGTTADITQKDLTVSVTATNRVYDSTTDTNPWEILFSTNAIEGDTITPNYTSATFDGPDVGTHSVSVSGISIGGVDANNYNLLNTTATATANITEQSATVTFDSGNNFNQTYTGSPISPITVTADPAVSTSVTYNGSTDIPVNAGTYTVIGFVTDANYAGQTDSQILTVSKVDQTITFNPLDGKNSSDPDFSVSATASSSLGVSFSASGQCTVSEGIVHITGPGDCTITASQIGNINYNAAPDVLQSFAIADNTPPAISGLSNDPTPTKSKTWTWSSDDETATYRFVVDQNLDGVPTGDYSNVKTATHASGDGTYYLHAQAKDTLGNESTVTTVSAVLDNTVPVLTLPADVTTSTTNSSGTAVTFTAPTATDNVDSSVTVACTPVSGSIFPIAVTTVNCSATDAAGNIATGTFKVTVTLTSTGGGSSSGGSTSGGTTTVSPPITATAKTGDANNDGKVDKYDFALIMANWGKTGTNVSDFNNDGKVDKYDFALLMSKWGT